MKLRLIIFMLLLGGAVGAQTTMICVDDVNNSTVSCVSCTDFDIGSARGVLVARGANDIFLHSPVKVEFGVTSVVLTSVHDQGAKSIRVTLSAFDPAYDTEAEIRLFFEGCNFPAGGSGGGVVQNITVLETGTDRTINISGGTGDTFSVQDNDSDPTNELFDSTHVYAALIDSSEAIRADFPIDTDTQLSDTDIANLGYIKSPDDADNDPNNEIQDLSVIGGNIVLSGGEGPIAIPEATITQPGSTIIVDLPDNLDNDPANEIQQLQTFELSGGVLSLTLENGGTRQVTISGIDTDDQTMNMSYANGTLNYSIVDGNSGTVDLSSLLNTDDQTLTGSYDNVNKEITIGISGGNSVIIPIAELSQGLSLNNDILDISNINTPIDLSGYKDNTDDQNLLAPTVNGDIITWRIENGYSQALNMSQFDDQAISESGDLLSIAGNASTVDLSKYLDNTDNQGLTYDEITNLLQLERSANVDLTELDDEVVASQPIGNGFKLDGSGMKIPMVFRYNFTGVASTASGAIDNQQLQPLDLTGNTFTITLEDGGSQSIELTGLDEREYTCTPYTGVTTSTITSSVTLPATDDFYIELNGVIMQYQATTPIHFNNYSTTGNEVQFSSGLDATHTVRICTRG